MTKVLKQAPIAKYSRIIAVGGVRGENTAPNSEIVEAIDSSDEWIQSRTGIKTRARARADEDVLDLATAAALDVIAKSGIDPAEIDTVILSTVTYFHQTPAGAAIVADRIGANPAAAFDISAACAGYCYGIGQADALVRAGTARNVLVIGAEKMSDFTDPTDRSISFILGDGAGAALVGASDSPGIGPTVWGSDGSKAPLIGQTHAWSEYREGNTEWPTLRQEGPSVFKWAVWGLAPIAQQALEAAGVTAADIDVFIPHQANARIIDQLAKQLKLPESVVIAKDIVETGNTSAASIPLATERLYRDGKVSSGDLALQIGFGAGLAYAAQVVVLP